MQVAVTAIGADRPGIVAAVTGVLVEHGANIEDSSMTILRGKVIVDHGRLLGNSTDGQWLKRQVSPEVLARPVV